MYGNGVLVERHVSVSRRSRHKQQITVPARVALNRTQKAPSTLATDTKTPGELFPRVWWGITWLKQIGTVQFSEIRTLRTPYKYFALLT